MTNILTLLGNSGSGITDVQVSAPLTVASSGTVRTVGINLGSYSTTAQMQALLNGKQDSLTAGGSISIVGNTISFDGSLYFTATQISLILTAYSTSTQMNTAIATALTPYSTTTLMNTAITTALTPYSTTTQMNTAISTALTPYSTTTQMNTAISTALTPYSTTTATNTAIATALTPYSTTAQTSVLLAAKQATLSVGAGCFLNGAVISGYGLRWNATNVPTGTIEELHFSGYTVAQTVNFGTSKVELTIGHPTDMATTTATKALIAANISVSNGLSALSNAAAGTVALSIDQSFQHNSISFTQTSKVLKCIIQNGAENLTWDGDALSTQAYVAQQLLTKQDLLTFQSETNAVGVIDQSNESATPPVYISWPGYSASTVVNAVGYQQLNGGVYKTYTSLTPGAVMHFSCEFQAGTANACSITVNDSTAWTNLQETFVSNLSTTVWKTEQWSWTVYPNGRTNIHFLIQAPGSAYTQPAGSVKIRNYTVSTSPNVTNFTSKISGHDIACTGTVSAVSVVSTSDETIKSEYQDPSADLLTSF